MTQPVITSLAALAHVLATKRHHDKRSQADLAETLGITQPTLSDWENGRATPAADKLIAWCHADGFDLILVRRQQTPDQGKLV